MTFRKYLKVKHPVYTAQVMFETSYGDVHWTKACLDGEGMRLESQLLRNLLGHM